MLTAIGISFVMLYLGVGSWAAYRVHRLMPARLCQLSSPSSTLIVNYSMRAFVLIMVFVIATAPISLLSYFAGALLN